MREWQMEANSCLKFYSRDNCVLGTVMACRREGAMGEGRLEGYTCWRAERGDTTLLKLPPWV